MRNNKLYLENTAMDTHYSKADIHIHTTYSDGSASIREVLGHVAQATDMRLIAITDHDTINGALLARQMATEFGIEVIVGEEVSTAEGHLLALFIERRLPPGRPASETIAAIHDQGGLCVAAHPFDPLVPSIGRAGLGQRCTGPRAGAWPLDGVEAFNAGSWIAAGNRRAATFGAALGLARCGGSDSHSLATIGLGFTLFPGAGAHDLYRAIQRGQTAEGGTRWRFDHYLEVATHRAHERFERRRGRSRPALETPALVEVPGQALG
jgi:predicted metal-dependent phosphoesterase TrpH